MRKILLILILFCGFGASRAQSFEVQQLLLNAEKLSQLKNILSDMKKGYDILSEGYNTVRNLSQGNFNLHQVFLNGLLAVSPTVKQYHKVGTIVSTQLIILKEYKAASAIFRQSNLFHAGELAYIDKVYSQLFKAALQHLDDLATLLTANQLRMTDDERLQAIDGIHADITDNLLFLRHFNSRTKVLAVQRSGARQETKVLLGLHGLK